MRTFIALILLVVFCAAVAWFLLSRVFKLVGSGASKLAKPFTQSEQEPAGVSKRRRSLK